MWVPPFGNDQPCQGFIEDSTTDRFHAKIDLKASSRAAFLSLQDETSDSQFVKLGVYPDLHIAAEYKEFSFFLAGDQVLDASSVGLNKNRELDLYRLGLGGKWKFHKMVYLAAAYRHNLGFLSWPSSNFPDGHTFHWFDHTPCFFAGTGFMPSTTIEISLGAEVPLLLKKSSETLDSFRLKLPVTIGGGIRFTPTKKFNLCINADYFIYSPGDSVIDAVDIPLQNHNYLNIRAEAAYRLIEPLEIKLTGEYSPSGFSELDTLWPDPGSVSVGAEGTWSKGPWDFSLLVGTEKYHPLSSTEGETLYGISLVTRAGVALKF